MTRQLVRTTACAVLALGASAWSPIATLQSRATQHSPITTTALFTSPDAKNPAWQDCYNSEDDDCLSATYSAAFVAEDWIKSMPCGKDVDCLPEKLSHPGTMGDAGVEKVDVMEYLNIKKAAPVSEKSSSEKGDSGP
ncbi:hypothetical protein ACHAXR_010159 [Thalassiosira sp. AJA248-18]